MTSAFADGAVSGGAAGAPARRASAAHLFCLALVWLTFAVSGVVYVEPAPHDVLLLGLIFLLPLARLARLTPLLTLYLGLWLLIAAGGFAASSQALRIGASTQHTAVTLLLSIGSVIVAAFLAANPQRHARLILSAYAFAATAAAGAGIVGYFDLAPGAADLFTLYGRIRGTFKDPNVLGPFLVPVLLYAIYRLMAGAPRQVPVAAATMSVALFGLLLTFSRGALLNAGVGLVVLAYLGLVTAPSNRSRLAMLAVWGLGAAAAVTLVVAALQVEAIANLFGQRMALAQEYDVGPEGRFAGQIKALDVIAVHPLGLGALEFSQIYHNEDVHNVYLSMFLNAGWIGGLAYFGLVFGTLLAGARYALSRGPTQGPMIVAVASLAGLVAEGFVVDTDHWRHFFLVMAMVWGLIAGRHGRGQAI